MAARATPLPPINLRYTGLYDFDAIYSAMIDWAKNYGYYFHENTYKHKVPSASGAEQEWLWIMEKKVNEFIQYTIKIKAHSWDMTEVSVDVEGKKKHLSTGRIYFVISGRVDWDWQKSFRGSKFRQWMGDVWTKLYFKDLDNVYTDPLYYRMFNLHAIMKKALDMQAKAFPYKGYLVEN